MTDAMLEAPARGVRISDLADGQGRILRLHDLTASSLDHTSHANPDRKPINVANQTESPTCAGGRVMIERKPDESDSTAVVHRLNDERDQRWQNLIAGFLVHASRGLIRHDGQHEYTAVLCGPQAAMPFDLGTDTHCIKSVGSRHYVDGWPLSDAHGRSTYARWPSIRDFMYR